ncbi:hypothetical protein HDC90_005188 [Pedobacter sp. AK013]|uniref:hypothetical protein n=1 Tax=Pedobacter sp. AK013 TaxID=2723071 RepID=UPI0016099164|nr:hypothetical protein [Pedobacter sp. AK013]MBB6240510.1 hypothetical protein [Pedobacter sp. AK013]
MVDLIAYQLELWTRRRLYSHYGEEMYRLINEKIFFPTDSSKYPDFRFAENMPKEIDTEELIQLIETFYENARAELICYGKKT